MEFQTGLYPVVQDWSINGSMHFTMDVKKQTTDLLPIGQASFSINCVNFSILKSTLRVSKTPNGSNNVETDKHYSATPMEIENILLLIRQVNLEEVSI